MHMLNSRRAGRRSDAAAAWSISGKLRTREGFGKWPGAKKYTSHYALVLVCEFYSFYSALRVFFSIFPAAGNFMGCSESIPIAAHARVYFQRQTNTCAPRLELCRAPRVSCRCFPERAPHLELRRAPRVSCPCFPERAPRLELCGAPRVSPRLELCRAPRVSC